jgi:hypothetical protein
VRGQGYRLKRDDGEAAARTGDQTKGNR